MGFAAIHELYTCDPEPCNAIAMAGEEACIDR